MSVRTLAVLFAIFILSIIILADTGHLRFLFRLVHQVENLDKVLHFLLMGTLTYLVSAGLIESFPERNINWIVFGTVTFLLIFFTVEEFSQAPIRGRIFSLLDLAANYLGIFVFGFFAWRNYKKKALK